MNDEKIEKPFQIIKRIWSYLTYEKTRIIYIFILVILSTIISIITPYITSEIIDKYILNDNIKLLIIILISLIILYMIKSISTYIMNIKMSEISENTLYKIRKELFDKMINLDMSFFDKNQKGDIMSRFTNDVTSISDALSETVVNCISSIITLIGVTIIMFLINTKLTIVTILTVPFFFILVIIIGMKTNQYFMKSQNEIGKLSSVTEDLLSGIKVTKSFSNEQNTINKFNNSSDKLRDIQIKTDLYSSLIMPANALITNIGNILIILIGSTMVLKQQTTVGIILAFITYASMFRMPINNLASLVTELGNALAGASRIFKILDHPINIDGNIKFEKLNSSIEFKNVDFGYNKNIILKNINLKINKGEVVAIVGPTGAGKTTLINLLTKFYLINNGEILLDGININDLNKKDLRNNIGIVLQDNYLFKGTVLDNIIYGNGTKEAAIKASKKSKAHDFIHRLPNGYDTIVEDEGSNFSEGEKQLIAITRVILSNPDILILDEATSNIDTYTEILVQDGMQELMKGKTCIIIAHRLSTIKNADKIVYLENGEILEYGNHEQLMAKHSKYYNLYMSQFK